MTSLIISKNQNIVPPKKETFASFIVAKDSTIGDIKALAFRILSACPYYISGGEEAIEKLKNKTKYIGILSYFKNAYHLFVTKETFKETSLKICSSILTVSSNSLSYLLLIPPLVTTSPHILTAVAIAKVVSSLAKGVGLTFSVANMYVNPPKKTVTSFINGKVEEVEEQQSPKYHMMVGVAAYAYTIMAPILLSAPKFVLEANFVGDVIVGSSAILGVVTDVSGYIFQRKIVEEVEDDGLYGKV